MSYCVSCCCCCCHPSGQALSNCRQQQMERQYHNLNQNYCHNQTNAEFSNTGKDFRLKDNHIQVRSKEGSKQQSRQTEAPQRRGYQTSSDKLVEHMADERIHSGYERPLTGTRYRATLQDYYRYNDHCERVASTGFSRNINGGFYKR